MSRSLPFLPLFLSSAFFFTASCSHAPYAETDVLAIAHAQDIKEADKNLELGRYCYKVFEYDNAQKYFTKGLDIAGTARYPDGIFSGHNNLGVLYTETGKYRKAWTNLYQALTLAAKGKKSRQLAEVFNNMAFLLMESGLSNTGFTVRALLDAARKNRPDLPIQLVVDNNRGLYLMSIREYAKAFGVFKKIRDIGESKNLYEQAVLATCHMGDALDRQGNPGLADTWYHKALDMANFWEYTRGKLVALQKLGKAAETRKDWPQALIYYQAIRSIHKGLNTSVFAAEDEKRIKTIEKHIAQ